MSNSTREELESRVSLSSDSDHALLDDNVLDGTY